MVINIIWLLYKMCEWFPRFDQNKRRNVVIDPAQSSILGCDSEPSVTNIKMGRQRDLTCSRILLLDLIFSLLGKIFFSLL